LRGPRLEPRIDGARELLKTEVRVDNELLGKERRGLVQMRQMVSRVLLWRVEWIDP
jgi:hypothetical protein